MHRAAVPTRQTLDFLVLKLAPVDPGPKKICPRWGAEYNPNTSNEVVLAAYARTHATIFGQLGFCCRPFSYGHYDKKRQDLL